MFPFGNANQFHILSMYSRWCLRHVCTFGCGGWHWKWNIPGIVTAKNGRMTTNSDYKQWLQYRKQQWTRMASPVVLWPCDTEQHELEHHPESHQCDDFNWLGPFSCPELPQSRTVPANMNCDQRSSTDVRMCFFESPYISHRTKSQKKTRCTSYALEPK